MTVDRVITSSEWDKALSRQGALSRTDLNRLVMDYLVIEGYQSAADALVQESGLQPSVDLNSIATRMHIRTAVQTGDMEAAIRQVNQLDPEVLDGNPHLFFRLQQQRLIELVRKGQALDALAFAAEEMVPLCEEHRGLLPQLERTMALLVFDVPGTQARTTSSSKQAPVPPIPTAVSELLAPTHRLQTAGELNAAILAAQSQNREPKLLQLLRLLIFGQTALGPEGPGNVSFPPLDLTSTLDLQSGAATSLPAPSSAPGPALSSSTTHHVPTGSASLLALPPGAPTGPSRLPSPMGHTTAPSGTGDPMIL